MTWFERHIPRQPKPLPPDASRDSLLEAVIAAPDEDEPRWVYSDFLLERDDPRGELIAVQLTLANLADDDDRREALVARQDDLLAKHKKKWTGDFKGTRVEYGVEGGQQWARSKNPMQWTFDRGFVDTVRMGTQDFVRNAGELLVREPVRQVQLTRAHGQLRSFFDECPHLERLRELNLARARLADDDLDALVTTRLANLEVLCLNLCRIGMKRAVKTLPRLLPENLPRLRGLHLIENGIGDRGVEALLTSPILAQLRDLGLGHNKVKAKGARAILENRALDGLERLNLLRHGIPPAEQQALRSRFGDRVLL